MLFQLQQSTWLPGSSTESNARTIAMPEVLVAASTACPDLPVNVEPAS
jgi:hypothetical protein